MADDVDVLRAEAEGLIAERGADGIFMRSCWVCNPAHAHFADVKDAVLNCFICGHWFFKGHDLTITDEAEDPALPPHAREA
jgi:hypothetical protein